MTVTQADFDYVRELIRRESAIVLDETKGYLIEARLAPIAREAGLETLATLVEALKRGSGELRARVVEALTTNETSFFRDVHPFEGLAAHVLPELVQARESVRQIRVWSAAASTGQEAFSIAMVLREHTPELADWNVRVRGTDISRGVIAQARDGRYAQLEVNRGLPLKMLTRYFDRDGLSWRVKPELRAMVEFGQMNLVAPWPAMGRFDIVFMRNVLIYFDLPTRQLLLDRMKSVLAPDGYLFLGSSEMMAGVHDGYRMERNGRALWYRPS